MDKLVDSPVKQMRDEIMRAAPWMPAGHASLAAEVCAAIAQKRVNELEAALRAAADAMTCRRDDDAHYCPNCDNSLYDARNKARAALPTMLKGNGDG